MILKKNEKFYFQFVDENLLSAWFNDECPQGLSWQSALKGYYTILWQKYKNRVFGFFFLWKWFLVLFKGTRTQKLMWKIPLKGYCMILKKNENFYFSIFWWKSVVGIRWGRTRLPKFKFSAKFSIGLHVILQNTDRKIRKWLLYYVKNHFNRKSVEVQCWTPLEIMLNGFCLKIIR